MTPNLSFLPLAIAVLAPPITAGAVAAKEHSSAAGIRAAVWAGLTGGMLIFIAYSEPSSSRKASRTTRPSSTSFITAAPPPR